MNQNVLILDISNGIFNTFTAYYLLDIACKKSIIKDMKFMPSIFIICLCLLPSLGRAQDEGPDDSSIIWEDFTSPVTTNSVYILASGLFATTVLGNDDRNLDEQAKDKAEFDPPFKSFGYIGETIGWGYLNTLYIIGFGFHGYFSQDKRSLERAEMMFSSSTFTLLATTVLKFGVKRSRPGFPEKDDSFPSGHASMSFNFASLVTAEHGYLWGIPAYLIASFVSYSRVNDGWHWLTDIMAGATIGASYGWGVYFNRRKVKPRFWFSVFPGDTKNSWGAQLAYEF